MSSGLIGGEILSLIGIVGLVTIALSAFMILYNHELYERVHATGFLSLFGAGEEPDGEAGDAKPRGHILVVGMNAIGRRIATDLHERGCDVLAVDTDPYKLAGLPCSVLLGNVEYRAVLEEADLDGARLLVSALRIEEVNRLLAYRAEQAGMPSAIHTFDAESTLDLDRAGVDFIIDSQALGVDRVVRAAYELGSFES
jgi:voltage-gated potassium channel Kch